MHCDECGAALSNTYTTINLKERSYYLHHACSELAKYQEKLSKEWPDIYKLPKPAHEVTF